MKGYTKSRGVKLLETHAHSGKWCQPALESSCQLALHQQDASYRASSHALGNLIFFQPVYFFFNLLTCRSPFYITGTALERYFVNIFSHCGACLFTHLVVSSDEKKKPYFSFTPTYHPITLISSTQSIHFSLHLNHEAAPGNFPPAYVYKQCGIDFYV